MSENTTAYPTDSMERRKKREKEAKEAGAPLEVKHKIKPVENHWDDCGESLASLRIDDEPTVVDSHYCNYFFTDDKFDHLVDDAEASPYSKPLQSILTGNTAEYLPHTDAVYYNDFQMFLQKMAENKPNILEVRGSIPKRVHLVAYTIGNDVKDVVIGCQPRHFDLTHQTSLFNTLQLSLIHI